MEVEVNVLDVSVSDKFITYLFIDTRPWLTEISKTFSGLCIFPYLVIRIDRYRYRIFKSLTFNQLMTLLHEQEGYYNISTFITNAVIFPGYKIIGESSTIINTKDILDFLYMWIEIKVENDTMTNSKIETYVKIWREMREWIEKKM